MCSLARTLAWTIWRLSELGVTMRRRRQSPMQKLAGFRFLLVGWLVFLSPIPAGAAPGPTEVVRYFYGQLLDTMQNASTLGAKGRYQKLEPVVPSTFDVPFMARLSI